MRVSRPGFLVLSPFLASTSIAVAVVVSACSSSTSTTSSGGGGADGSAPATFTDVYTNVISTHCAPCHTTATGDGVKFGKLDMTSKATAYANLVGTAAAGDQCGGKGTRVVPNQPDSSVMYLKISLDDPSPCGAKMPLGGPALAQGDVDKVESWIKGGAKND